MLKNKTAADKYILRVCWAKSINDWRFRYEYFCECAIMFICGLRAHVRAIERGLGVWDMEHETHNMDVEHGTWNKGFFCIPGEIACKIVRYFMQKEVHQVES